MASGVELSTDVFFTFSSQFLIQRVAEPWRQLCKPKILLLIGSSIAIAVKGAVRCCPSGTRRNWRKKTSFMQSVANSRNWDLLIPVYTLESKLCFYFDKSMRIWSSRKALAQSSVKSHPKWQISTTGTSILFLTYSSESSIIPPACLKGPNGGNYCAHFCKKLFISSRPPPLVWLTEQDLTHHHHLPIHPSPLHSCCFAIPLLQLLHQEPSSKVTAPRNHVADRLSLLFADFSCVSSYQD